MAPIMNSIVLHPKLCWQQYEDLDSSESNSATSKDSLAQIRSYSMASRSMRVQCSRRKLRDITLSPSKDSANIPIKAGARQMVCIHCKKHSLSRARSNADIARLRKFSQQNRC